MTHLLVIDPGKSTGITLGTYSDTEPYQRVEYWQFGRGLYGLSDWISDHIQNNHLFWYDPDGEEMWVSLDHVTIVTEKFVPLQNKGFGLTLDSVEPLRLEGVLVHEGLMPDYAPEEKQWQRADKQYFMGGTKKPEKRKRAKDFLRKHGLYLTGKNVGCKDAEDVVSSQLHAFAYLRGQRHLPTLNHYFRSTE